ncbi:ATP-binding protein [Vulcanisaeta distributa]|uniref:ATPase AAA-type core domain-containing protein n=1 Tax=Vulcanisaeta distributa (strain DSM 14429 / JCM 11212 / NBRC 100878 / IC-017) TaxID=572478 RepID=E1QSV0_VULDI|nr:ATP-binding protein [Vulcanisaeta distributa]ADN50817.1 conserved hypothetical protein [Vulcanisaeta distributa DSM 14429]
MAHIKRIMIEEIRRRKFNVSVKGKSGGLNNELTLSRVNVLTGCNGSFKTSILEALAASLLMLTDPSRAQSLFTVASTLRMDEFWLYRLLNDGFKLMVDDVEVKTTSIEELIKLQQPSFSAQPLMPVNPFTKAAIAEKGNKRGFLRVDVIPVSMFPQQVQYSINITVNKIDGVNYDFIALSTPNPLTPQFIGSLMKIVDYAKAIKLFNKVFEGVEISFMGLKPDEFDKHNIVFVVKDGERPIQYLGSGYLGLALMVLAASREIVMYDNVELHMHPWLMNKVAELMSDTKDVQWIITTQSSEMLNAMLNNVDLDELLVIESNARGLLRIYDGREASRRVGELNEDLRGNCL